MGRIESFCRERDLISLAGEPLSIVWTPVFMRAYGRAFLDSPGPLDSGQQSHFFITPPADDALPEAIESYMREDNDRMLRLLCIHEGVPGHYLQLAASNRCPSLIRTVFGDGMFAEGWAVYVTQVMMDAGYGADDPALLLTHWKFYLRAVANAILDVETHTRGMTEERRSTSWSGGRSRRRTRRAPSGCAPDSRPRSCPRTTSARWRCWTSRSRHVSVPRWRLAASVADVPRAAHRRRHRGDAGLRLRAHLESVIATARRPSSGWPDPRGSWLKSGLAALTG